MSPSAEASEERPKYYAPPLFCGKTQTISYQRKNNKNNELLQTPFFLWVERKQNFLFWCVLFWGGKSFFCFFAARGKRGVIIKRELEKIY